MIRVVLADDDVTLREGVRELLELVGEIKVVGEAADGEQAVAVSKRVRPDVLVIDLNMPVVDGMAAAWLLATAVPELSILFLTGYDRKECIRYQVPGNVRGFVLKTDVVEILGSAIQAVYGGQVYLPPHHETGQASGGKD
jgi:two-component system response regulator DesR